MKNKEIADKIIAKARIDFKGDISIKTTNETPCFAGANNLRGKINIAYNHNYPLHKVPVNNSFPLALEAVVAYESVHSTGCPINESKDLKSNDLLIINQNHFGEEDFEWFGIKAKIKFIPYGNGY